MRTPRAVQSRARSGHRRRRRRSGVRRSHPREQKRPQRLPGEDLHALRGDRRDQGRGRHGHASAAATARGRRAVALEDLRPKRRRR